MNDFLYSAASCLQCSDTFNTGSYFGLRDQSVVVNVTAELKWLADVFWFTILMINSSLKSFFLKVKMPKCWNLLVFLQFIVVNWIYLSFWPLTGQNKQFKDAIFLGDCDSFFTDFHFIEFMGRIMKEIMKEIVNWSRSAPDILIQILLWAFLYVYGKNEGEKYREEYYSYFLRSPLVRMDHIFMYFFPKQCRS